MKILRSVFFLSTLGGIVLSFKLHIIRQPSIVKISYGPKSNLVGKAVVDSSELESGSSSDIKAPANAPSSSASISSLQHSGVSKIVSEPVLSVQYDDIWMVDSDSAELEVESSSDKKRKRELLERAIAESQARADAEARKLQQAEAAKKELESASTKNSVQLEQTVGPVTPTPAFAKSSQLSLTSNESSGFDIGLLIAFPLMIGTLGFFLFFPFIGEILSASSSTNVSVQ